MWRKKKRWGFTAHSVNYYICDNCGHLNGAFQDTDDFCASIYENEESTYADDYNDIDFEKFNERVKAIYLPKVDFLQDVLDKNTINSQSISILDVGAGTGHFLRALEIKGIHGVGIEVDKKQVNRAKKFLSTNDFEHIPSGRIVDRIREGNESCVSFIYVLEHAVNLNEILEAVQSNDHIKFIFFSVPMFSYSVILEQSMTL